MKEKKNTNIRNKIKIKFNILRNNIILNPNFLNYHLKMNNSEII